MSNEPAERLRWHLASLSVHNKRLANIQLDLALAAERKATVERIRAEIFPTESIDEARRIGAILDAEAAR